MLFSLKSYAKKCFTVWRNYISIKSYSTFSANMFQAPFILYNGILYTLYGSECRFFTLYGSECREEEKKGKTWRNEVDTKTVKIATSEIHISILKRNFTILLRTFFHNFLRGITYQKLIFYGRIPLKFKPPPPPTSASQGSAPTSACQHPLHPLLLRPCPIYTGL